MTRTTSTERTAATHTRSPKRLVLTAADLIDFADYLAQIFGSRHRALAAFLRSTAHYRAWRQSVEWCPLCRHHVPIDRDPPAEPNVIVYREHYARDGSRCRASGRATRWAGEEQLRLDAAAAAALDAITLGSL